MSTSTTPLTSPSGRLRGSMKGEHNSSPRARASVDGDSSMVIRTPSARKQATHHDEHDDDIGTRANARTPNAVWIVLGLMVVGGALAALFSLGYIPLTAQHKDLDTAAQTVKTSAPRVAIVTPERAPTVTALSLPGELEALRETAIFAHMVGFLKKWNVDIGASVKEGQELAVIESPETDTQLQKAHATKLQAEAALAQSKAQVEQFSAAERQSAAQLANQQATEELAKLTMDRYEGLRGKGIVSDQEIAQQEAALKVARASVKAGEAAVGAAKASTDASRAAVKSAEANVGVAQADVKRFEALQNFEKVIAPFSGTIVARQTEVGNMVMDGSGTASQPLFQLAQTDTLRLFIDVPQSHSTEIHDGQPVELAVREYPGRVFKGIVARTSKALDPASRTLRTEIQIPNPKGELLRGMYAQASLSVTHDAPVFLLPSSALIVNSEGTQVALVREGRVHFQKVQVEGDYGQKVAVSTGIGPGDAVIATPSERLLENMAVTSGK